MVEIFSHNVSVREDEEAEEAEVYIISGLGWDNEPFSLYLNKEAAQTLLWQISFLIETESNLDD